MVNMNNLMKQAQMMQKKLQAAQEEISSREYTGNAGGGMVTATILGTGEAKSVKINPEILTEDIEILEDLVVTAFKNAKKKLDEDTQNNMSSLVPPGFKMPF